MEAKIKTFLKIYKGYLNFNGCYSLQVSIELWRREDNAATIIKNTKLWLINQALKL
jgi:hypothetical protein